MSTLAERFEDKYEPEPTTGCWLWTAGATPNGYGRISVGGRQRGAHQVAWELVHGPVPVGLWVLHRCDTKLCVNVRHLFLGTVLDNNRDALAKGRHHHAAKAACEYGHPFTPENTYVWRGVRTCRACRRRNDAARRARDRRMD